jgi:pimeloyl-ACP methyl ester carboxylesterase
MSASGGNRMRARAAIILGAGLAIVALVAAFKRDDRPAAPLMPPLAVPSPTATLAVSGFGSAVVALPVGATRPAPVVVAVLGIGDSPEEQCSAWREIVGTRAFVLCPRGSPHMVEDAPEEAGVTQASDDPAGAEEDAAPAPVRRPDAGRHQVGYYPVDVASLDRELNAALGALKARYGAYVAERDLLYAGFSRGAFLGAQLATKRPLRFRRLVLIEGGQTPWQPETAAAFARSGGERVLFVCGQPQCVDESEPAAAALRAERVSSRVVHGAGEGHGYRKQVKEELRQSFDWVIDGQPVWNDSAR